MLKVPYRSDLKNFSKKLRNNSTLSEVLLWNKLKNKKFGGMKFNRQKPLDRYIVDFYCHELSLVIEIDGGTHSHLDIYLNDIERQKVLENRGLCFIRFSDLEVKKDMGSILIKLENFIEYQKELKKENPPSLRDTSFTKEE